MFTEPQGAPGPHLWLSKYPMLAFQGSGLAAAEAAQRNHPDTPLFRMFTPRLTLETVFERFGDCTQGLGIPFARSAATTGGCNVWAGHFLYNTGARLTEPIAAEATSILVDNGSGFDIGQYVVIHDGGPTEFKNAEHARITAIDGNRLTLSARYKSTAQARRVGAIVRQHESDNVDGRRFVFNLSTAAPRDPNGVAIGDYMADWLVDNLTADLRKQNRDVTVSGLTFDVDSYIDVFTSRSDTNNDLQADGGISPTGTHWWGEGVDRFYQRLRQQLPDSIIVGGTQFAYGFETNNGMQIEGFPNGPLHRPVDDYSRLNSTMISYLYHMGTANSHGPRTVQLLMKHGSTAYPTHGTAGNGNGAARLGLALAAMDGGVFHHENTPNHPDTWYDEYSVITDRSSPDYGRAVPHDDVAVVRANTGWLGQPLGRFRRLVDSDDFAERQALILSGFENSTDGWRGRGVTVSRTAETDPSGRTEGQGALAISEMSTFAAGPMQAAVVGPAVELTAGQDYTITFSAKAVTHRWIRLQLGNDSTDVLVGPEWRRYVVPFRAAASKNAAITVGVGRQNGAVSLDAVRVFGDSDANVLRRDFERGVVIANATPDPVTVDLGPGYRRIEGTQDRINDGLSLPSQVTIGPRDALFAIRR